MGLVTVVQQTNSLLQSPRLWSDYESGILQLLLAFVKRHNFSAKYLESAHQHRGDFVPGLPVQAKYFIPFCCRCTTDGNAIVIHSVLTNNQSNKMELTACNLLQPRVKHIQFHSLRACVWQRQLFCIECFLTGGEPLLNQPLQH